MSHYYITTPIYYVNDRPHIGHAYTSVACDVLARFKRLSGENVRFLTGTDEHGQKVEKSAAAQGISPQAMADANSQHFRDMAQLMNISNDDFIRTTEPRHKKAAQALWKKMADQGFITLGSYAGWYAVRDEAYYAESELVNGKAPTGADVEWVEEPSYFFTLSEFQDKLLAFYEANPGFIQPDSRRNEIISFVKGGLRDLSISRTTFSWGIPVPITSPNRGEGVHIMYVWLDALTNYLSALGYPENTPEMAFWPASLHMVGKDIIRFHAVYWPAFLMAADLPLPKQVFAHGWWTIEGEKMSKSLGNAIAPADLVAEFGLDQTRWFLMREVPFGNDGNFSRERMITVINSELANNIGNLCQRTLSMIAKNCDGKVPNWSKSWGSNPDDIKKAVERALALPLGEYAKLTKEETAKLESLAQLYDSGGVSASAVGIRGIDFETIADQVSHCQFDKYLGNIIKWSSEANEYIDKYAPWTFKKESKLEEMEAVLFSLAESIRKIAILLWPVIPTSAAKILDQLAVPPAERGFKHLSAEFALKPGTPLPPPSGVFPRVGGAV
ncbi:MAG: methionine--tRNA ligase [Alphaproteobacteria bacterium]|nr:methionine--tRNA ligase [Alphaproteobacteria bacterium]